MFLYNSKFDLTAKSLVTNSVVITRVYCTHRIDEPISVSYFSMRSEYTQHLRSGTIGITTIMDSKAASQDCPEKKIAFCIPILHSYFLIYSRTYPHNRSPTPYDFHLIPELKQKIAGNKCDQGDLEFSCKSAVSQHLVYFMVCSSHKMAKCIHD